MALDEAGTVRAHVTRRLRATGREPEPHSLAEQYTCPTSSAEPGPIPTPLPRPTG